MYWKDPSLVLWLTFDEEAGNIAYDYSGKGNNGTIYGALRVKSPFNRALSFDGVDDYVNCGNILNFEGNAPYTLAVWFNSFYPTYGWPRVISREIFSPNRNGYLIYIEKSNNLIGTERWVNGTAVRITTRVIFNVWNFAVATYDGSKLRFYLNGNKIAEANDTRSMITFSANLTIGCASTMYDFFYGIIDEVMIFNRALSDAEISRLYYDYIKHKRL